MAALTCAVPSALHQQRRRRRSAACAAMRLLNLGTPEEGPVTDVLQLSQRLQTLMLAVKSDCISDDGSRVDYARAASSSSLAAFAAAARSLQEVEVEQLGAESEQRCFFINLYNALTVYGLCTLSPLPTSPQAVQAFWDSTALQIGRRQLTLNDIEHGILRGNGAHPAGQAPHWALGDERVSLSLPLDARVHFALNCGARSCPPIRVFSPANLEFGLAAAAAGFLEAETEVSETGVVTLSSLLLWYAADFGATQEAVLARVAAYMPAGSSKRAALLRLLETAGPYPPAARLYNATVGRLLPTLMKWGAIQVRFSPYDWTLNG